MINLEERVQDLEKRVQKLESNKIEVQSLSNTEAKLLEIINDIKPQDLVVIVLRLNVNFSKNEIKKTLQDCGCDKKTMGWFNGGNFNKRLIDKGIIISNTKNEKNKDVFSLSKIKGIKKANEIFQKYSLN